MTHSVSRLQRWLQRLVGEDLAGSGLGNLFAAQAVPLAGMVVLHFLTAAALGPAGKGHASFMVMAAGLGSSILFCSLHVGALQAIRSGDTSGALRGLLGSLAFGSIPVMAAGLVLVLGEGVGPSFLGTADWAIMLAGTGLAIVGLYALRTIQGLGLSKAFRSLTLLQAYTYFLGTGVGLLVGITPTMVIAAWTLGQAVSLFAGLRVLAREAGLSLSPRPRVPILRSALAAHAGNLGHQLMYRVDIVLLGILGTAAQVGVYAMAIAVAEPLLLVAEAFALSTFAEGRERLSAGERRTRLAHHIKVYRRVAALGAAILVGVGLLFFGYVIDGFERSFTLLLILLPGVWMGGIGRIRLGAVIAADDRRTSMIIGAAAVVGSLVYLPLIHYFNAYGAAAASSLVYSAHALLLGRILENKPSREPV
jgi:O-antigen/teichoic acid export membrane protein